MNNRKNGVPNRFLAVISAAVFFGGCQLNKPEQNQPQTPVAIPKVAALGRIQPETDIRKVAAPGATAGDRIEEILVKENQWVKKGQPLATLNSSETLKASVAEATQQVAVAQSKMDQVKAGAKKGEIRAQEYKIESVRQALKAQRKAQDEIVDRYKFEMEEALRQHKRYDKLFKDGAVSASDADRYLVHYQSALKTLGEAQETRTGKLRTLEAQVEEAVQTRDKIAEVRDVDVNVVKAELDKANAVRNRATQELAYATVKAPQDGQILSILLRPGDRATGTGIFEMADTNKMIAVAEVYQTDAPKIFLGQKATITSDGFKRELSGTVYELGSQVTKQKIFASKAGENQDLRVVEVKLRLDPKDIEEGVKRASNLQVNVVFEPKN